jgi:hypothetical protein
VAYDIVLEIPRLEQLSLEIVVPDEQSARGAECGITKLGNARRQLASIH